MRTITRWLHSDCEETAEHLSDHLEGDLRGLRRRRILRHLARCELCAAAFQSLLRTVEALRTLGRPELEAEGSTADTVVERIRSEPEVVR